MACTEYQVTVCLFIFPGFLSVFLPILVVLCSGWYGFLFEPIIFLVFFFLQMPFKKIFEEFCLLLGKLSPSNSLDISVLSWGTDIYSVYCFLSLSFSGVLEWWCVLSKRCFFLANYNEVKSLSEIGWRSFNTVLCFIFEDRFQSRRTS